MTVLQQIASMTTRLQVYDYITQLQQDGVRLNIKTSHGNRVNSRTLGIFMAGTELD